MFGLTLAGAQSSLSWTLSFRDRETETAYFEEWVRTYRSTIITGSRVFAGIHAILFAVMLQAHISHGEQRTHVPGKLVAEAILFATNLIVAFAAKTSLLDGTRRIAWRLFFSFVGVLAVLCDVLPFLIDGADPAQPPPVLGFLTIFPLIGLVAIIVGGHPWHHTLAVTGGVTSCFAAAHFSGILSAYTRAHFRTDDIAAMAMYVMIGTLVGYFHEARLRMGWVLARLYRRSKDEADAGLRAKSLFLSNTNHELRTPLHGIIGMTDLLLETELSEEQFEYLGTVRRCSETLMQMVCDILDLEKAAAGQLELEQAPFAIGDAVESVTDMLFFTAHQKGVDIACIVDPSLHYAVVEGDCVRFKQIALNFASNAVKFSSPRAGLEGSVRGADLALRGGQVTVRAERAEAPTETEAGDGRLWVRLAVDDNGIGIAGEQLSKLFRPFQQLDATHTRKYGGSGLGLALVKSIAERMGGSVAVRSAPGEGSTFTVTLPFTLPAQCGIPWEPSPRGAALRGRAALRLRPWRGSTRAALARLLRAEGFDCDSSDVEVTAPCLALLVTDDGEEAAAARAARPDLPVIELATPGERRGDAARRPGRLLLPVKLAALQAALRSPDSLVLGPCSDGPLERRPPSPHTPASDPNTPPPSPGPVTQAARILIAEDNPVNARLLSRMLTRLGFEHEVVDNGLAAVESCRTGRFHALITDIQMPEKSGLEACRELRALEAKGAVPKGLVIIGCTANATKEDRELALAIGFQEYLSKPCRLHQLQEVMSKASLFVSIAEKEEGMQSPSAICI